MADPFEYPDHFAPTFHDQLASLCGPAIAAAMRENDTERAAEIVTALVTMAGRTIARACRADSTNMDEMLTAAEQLMISEAAGMAGIIGLVKKSKAGGRNA